MQNITTAWRRDPIYNEINTALNAGKTFQLSGLPLLADAGLLAAMFKDDSKSVLVLTSSEESAQALYDNLRVFCGDDAMLFPVLELLPFEMYAHNIELSSARIKVLSSLAQGKKILVVACANAYVRRLAPMQDFLQYHMTLHCGDVIAPDELSARLVDMGYERTPLTEIPGTFSLRGSIVDIYPIVGVNPYRIEFFDDEIESIRSFDASGQRSVGDAREIVVCPANELPVNSAARARAYELLKAEYEKTLALLHGLAKKELQNSYAPLLEYLQEGVWSNNMDALASCFYPQAGSIIDYLQGGTVVVCEPDLFRDTCIRLEHDRALCYADLLEGGRLMPSFFDSFINYEELCNELRACSRLNLSNLGVRAAGLEPDLELTVPARELRSYASEPESFIADIRQFILRDYTVLLTASSKMRIQRIEEIMRENGSPKVNIVQAGFTAGFESSRLKLAVITENELFARKSKKRHRRTYGGGEKIAHFMDLRVDDYVVHLTQGIGQYKGVERLKIGENERDYLLIKYAGEDKLYVPVDQLDLIQKYIGSETGAPKLYKLGGGEWARVKSKVKSSIREMADELLKLYAAREQTEGFAFSADTPWQNEFEDAFPYVETSDQLSALAEIKHDMEDDKVMDRLLCGDVGYGKTEIALRAAFKAIMDGKQVALLVPTTVLAQQHYHTIEDRFRSFPVSYACLSRLTSTAQKKELLAKLANGELDLLVGTHRMLSQDVVFKDLGLLIVDEEQRFGVSHKEKIKKLKTQVDVLTLSATPIPRTLHMSLVGMRDMSIISTPPDERYPVQTYVVEYHDQLIRDAVLRELGRGGQVFFVHNRVFDIYEVAENLEKLIPSAQVKIAHGQLSPKELETVMLDFVSGEGDILLCTTIIESGLDIPNANTLIVDDADMFGLSQLYQLRGRVGRSDRHAFAYFTYKRDRIINDLAKKRLIAIRDFTELGSGFKIAMRDLELRGAGNILGSEQHGHIAAVGFDLYCKMLAEEIDRSRGNDVHVPEVSTQIDLQIKAYIPDNFVDDSVLKMEIYKRMAATESLEQISELASTMYDRYGRLPAVVENLLNIGKVKVLARRLAISSVVQKPSLIELKFAPEHPVQPEHCMQLLDEWGKKLSFSERKGFAVFINTADLEQNLDCVDRLIKVLYQLEQAVFASGKAV